MISSSDNDLTCNKERSFSNALCLAGADILRGEISLSLSLSLSLTITQSRISRGNSATRRPTNGIGAVNRTRFSHLYGRPRRLSSILGFRTAR